MQNGATVTATDLSVDNGKYGCINIDAKGYTENPTSLTVTGTLTVADNSIWADPTNTLGTANGQVSVNIAGYYTVDARPNAYLWVTDITSAEAKIGDVYYATLASAVAAVPANGTATITLLKDVAITGSTFANTAGKNITVEGTGTAPTVTLGWKSCQASNGGTITFKKLSVIGHDYSNEDWFTEQLNGATKVVYDTCTITGLITIYPTSEFTACIFNTNGYYSIFVYNNSATFTRCIFNSDINRWVKIYDEGGNDTETLTLIECTFVDNDDGTNKACVEIDSTYGPLVVNITNTYAPDGETLYRDAKTPSPGNGNR